jgi:O-antigen ligase
VYAGTAFFVYAIVSAFYVRIYKPIPYRLLAVLFTAFGVLLVLLTGSRGPLVSIVPAGIVFALLVGRKKAGLTVICIAALAFSLFLSGVLPRITEYFSDSVAFGTAASQSVFDRLDLTTMFLEMFKQNPVLGFGPGMIQKLGEEGLLEYKRVAGLENQYATILAEGGVLAGCTYLLFIFGVIVLPFRIFKTSRSEEVKHLALITLVLFIYLFAGAAFANFLTSPILNTIIAIFAIAVARHETSKLGPHGSYVLQSAF